MKSHQSVQQLKDQLNLAIANEANNNPPPPDRNQDEINLARAKITASRQQKAGRIKNYINDPNKNIYKGKTIEELVTLWNTDRQGVLQQLGKFEEEIRPKGFSARQLGISYQEKEEHDRQLNAAMNDVAMEKLGFILNSNNLDAIAKHLNIQDVGLRKKLKELILLDDWDMLIPAAANAFIEYGPSAISWLWDRFVKPMMLRVLPTHDEGLTLFDYSNNNIQDPNKVSMIPNVNMFSEKLKDLAGSEQLLKDAVNRDYLATLITPERFCFRRPMPFPKRTALVSGSTQFVLQSDDNGNTAFYVAPWNATIPDADNKPESFYAAYNLTGLNPSTGAWTAATYVRRPLDQTIFNRWTLTAMAVQVTPIASPDSAAGNFQMAFMPEVGLGLSKPAYPQAGLAQSGYYQSGNALTTYRSIWLPTSFGQEMYANEEVLGFQDGFYGLLTGCEANTAIAKVEIHYVYEIIPTVTQTQYSVVDFATPGVKTNDVTTTLAYVCPGMQMLTLPDAFELSMCFKSAQPNYDGTLICALEKMMNWKRPSQKHAPVVGYTPNTAPSMQPMTTRQPPELGYSPYARPLAPQGVNMQLSNKRVTYM